jgi:hypothetical protein
MSAFWEFQVESPKRWETLREYPGVDGDWTVGSVA